MSTDYCGHTTATPWGGSAVCTRIAKHLGPHCNPDGRTWPQDSDNPHTPVRTAVWDNFLRTLGHHPDTVTKVVVEKGHIIVDSTTIHQFEESD